jgi:hypothetical protein
VWKPRGGGGGGCPPPPPPLRVSFLRAGEDRIYWPTDKKNVFIRCTGSNCIASLSDQVKAELPCPFFV